MGYEGAVGRQREIYINGFRGKRPGIPVDYPSLEAAAKQKLSKEAWGYISTGAGTETTIAFNQRSFTSYEVVPRMLKEVKDLDTRVDLFGQSYASPYLFSPIGVLCLASDEGDVKVAKAAASHNAPMIISNQASTPMEHIARALGPAPRWFQLYYSQSDELARSLVHRAEACGCQAIVVTLDTTRLGWRYRDLANAYLPFLEGRGIAQYWSDPVFNQILEQSELQPREGGFSMHALAGLISLCKRYPGSFWSNFKSLKPLKAVQQFIRLYSRPDLNWEDVQKVREWTSLPVILKGILHEEDAKKAKSLGFDGLMISNHGGRQVDGSIASLDALVRIREVCGDDWTLILDSGIRSGKDAFIAMALGANAVGVGRPYAYALAINGQEGVEELISNLRAELELNMALSGCRSVSTAHQGYVRRKV
jgi:lactate 2-monooxygenase